MMDYYGALILLFGVFVVVVITSATLWILKMVLDNDKKEEREREVAGAILDFRVQYFLAHPLELTLDHKQYGILVNPVVEALPSNVFKPTQDTCLCTPQVYQDDPRGWKLYPELAHHADSELHLKAELFREPTTNFKLTQKYGSGYKGKRIVLPARELNRINEMFNANRGDPDSRNRYKSQDLRYAARGGEAAKQWAMHYFRQNPSEVVVNHPRYGLLWHPQHEQNLKPLFRQYLNSIAQVMPEDIDVSLLDTEDFGDKSPDEEQMRNEVDLDMHFKGEQNVEYMGDGANAVGKPRASQRASQRGGAGAGGGAPAQRKSGGTTRRSKK